MAASLRGCEVWSEASVLRPRSMGDPIKPMRSGPTSRCSHKRSAMHLWYQVTKFPTDEEMCRENCCLSSRTGRTLFAKRLRQRRSPGLEKVLGCTKQSETSLPVGLKGLLSQRVLSECCVLPMRQDKTITSLCVTGHLGKC